MTWRGPVLALVIGAFVAGCNYRAAFEDYCADTGHCQCTGGDCCVVELYRCEQFDCCAGLECRDGMCQVPVTLTPSPEVVDFGAVRDNARRTVAVTLTNTGKVATPNTPELTVSGEFGVAATDCERILAAGETCTVTIESRPRTLASRIEGTLAVEYGRKNLKVPLRMQTAAELRIYATAVAPVTELDVGWVCPVSSPGPDSAAVCTWTVPFDYTVRLEHAPVRVGYSMEKSTVCTWTDLRCTFVATTSLEVRAQALANLQLLVRGTGEVRFEWGYVEYVCTRTGTATGDVTYCPFAMTGSVTLKATPFAPATRVVWQHACAPATGDTCTVTLSDLAYVTALFE